MSRKHKIAVGMQRAFKGEMFSESRAFGQETLKTEKPKAEAFNASELLSAKEAAKGL